MLSCMVTYRSAGQKAGAITTLGIQDTITNSIANADISLKGMMPTIESATSNMKTIGDLLDRMPKITIGDVLGNTISSLFYYNPLTEAITICIRKSRL